MSSSNYGSVEYARDVKLLHAYERGPSQELGAAMAAGALSQEAFDDYYRELSMADYWTKVYERAHGLRSWREV